MKKNVVIFGKESHYWLGLMEYMNRQGTLQVFLCTDGEALESVVEKRRAEYVLMKEEEAESVSCSVPVICFSASKTGNGIYRYQPVDVLYEELCLQVFHGENKIPGRSAADQIIAVYSPLGRSGKTSFACAYARRTSFFYLGMEEYGSIGNNNMNMDEVLYYIKTRNPEVIDRLKDGAEEWEGIRVFSSPHFFQDLRVMTGDDFVWFLERIREDRTFPPVIVDFGSGCLIDPEILDAFDRVYIPVLEGAEETRKLNRFRELLLEVNGPIAEKLVTVSVPSGSWKGDDFLERVQYRKGLVF